MAGRSRWDLLVLNVTVFLLLLSVTRPRIHSGVLGHQRVSLVRDIGLQLRFQFVDFIA